MSASRSSAWTPSGLVRFVTDVVTTQVGTDHVGRGRERGHLAFRLTDSLDHAREQRTGLFYVSLQRAGTGDGEKFPRLFGEIRGVVMCGYRLVDLVQHAP